jgi:hypothetical protein
MLEAEVRAILQELMHELGASSVRITDRPEDRSGVPARTAPLGNHQFLRVELGDRSVRPDIDATIERACRLVRSAQRRWNAPELPAITAGHGAPTPQRAAERLREFLAAAMAVARASQCVVLVQGSVIASHHPVSAAQGARLEFVTRRLIGTRDEDSSHGELCDDDLFALEFWYHATLVLFLDGPYPVDFVRYRMRHLCRELGHLLALLAPDPGPPAMTQR